MRSLAVLRVGESGIRTHDGLATMSVFKTGALNRSAISPQNVAPALPQGSFLDANKHLVSTVLQHRALQEAQFRPGCAGIGGGPIEDSQPAAGASGLPGED